MAVFASLYALAMGIALQFLLLPVVFPHLHAGDGLLRGGDWVGFHRIALDLATAVESQGWTLWELRPEGQAPAGVAAMLYVWTGVHAPYVMLPLNACLLGLAASHLLILLQRVIRSPLAWVGVMPLVLFPSSMHVYGQLHKDVFAISGVFLLLNAMLDVLKPWSVNNFVVLALRMFIGMSLIWIVRPYLVDVVLLAFWCGVVISAIGMWIRGRQVCINRFLVMVLLAVGLQFCFIQLVKKVEKVEQVEQVEQVSVCTGSAVWDLMPCRLGVERGRFIDFYPDDAGFFDKEIRIDGLLDFAIYLPRALSIGLLGPFPTDWLSEWRRVDVRMMRRAYALEMMIAYSAYLGLIFAIFRRCMVEPEFWSILGAALVILLIYSVAIPHVPTLYRMRLHAWHVFIGMGCVLLATVWLGRSRDEKN